MMKKKICHAVCSSSGSSIPNLRRVGYFLLGDVVNQAGLCLGLFFQALIS
jgi:hypothetical protein